MTTATSELSATDKLKLQTCSSCDVVGDGVHHYSLYEKSAVALCIACFDMERSGGSTFVAQPLMQNAGVAMNVGNMCDCLDDGVWRTAQVIATNIGMIHIHFIGWNERVGNPYAFTSIQLRTSVVRSDKLCVCVCVYVCFQWDAWISSDDQCIQPFRTQTHCNVGSDACSDPPVTILNDSIVFQCAAPVALTTIELFKFSVVTRAEEHVSRNTIQYGNDIFVPVQLVPGNLSGEPDRVLFRAHTRVLQFATLQPSAEQVQIKTEEQIETSAKATISELSQALPRSEEAIEAAVEAASDGHADMNDIGALTIERHRIKKEIKRQEALALHSNQEIARLQALIDADLQTNLRYTCRLEERTPSFELLLGTEHVNMVGDQAFIIRTKCSKHKEHVATINFGKRTLFSE
jgi:hypothetical protein